MNDQPNSGSVRNLSVNDPTMIKIHVLSCISSLPRSGRKSENSRTCCGYHQVARGGHVDRRASTDQLRRP